MLLNGTKIKEKKPIKAFQLEIICTLPSPPQTVMKKDYFR